MQHWSLGHHWANVDNDAKYADVNDAITIPTMMQCSQVARLKTGSPVLRVFEEKRPSNSCIFVILPVFLQSSARLKR